MLHKNLDFKKKKKFGFPTSLEKLDIWQPWLSPYSYMAIIKAG